MKVAVVGPYPRWPGSPRGGVEAAIENLVGAVGELGVEVRVFDPFTGYEQVHLGSNISVIRLNQFGSWRALSTHVPRALRKAVHAWAPDVLHVHLGAQYARMHPASILTVHGFPHLESAYRNTGLSGRVRTVPLRHAFEVGLRRAAAMIAISEEAALFAARAGVQVVDIPNPIAVEFFEVDRNPGYDFVSVGNIMRRKNQLDLVRAFGEFVAAGGRGDLLVVGEVEDRQYFERCKSEAAAFDSRVQFIGPASRSEVATLLGTARASVSTSLRETSSIAISESFAANCPVVCFDVGTANGQVLDQRFGKVLPTNSSPVEIAGELARVGASRIEGEPLRSSVANQHPVEVARRTVELYKSVAIGR